MGNTAEASTGPGATRTQLRRWFVGYFLNLVGSQAFYLILAWYARESTGSDSLVGTVTSLCALCRATFLPIGGILADRRGIETNIVLTNTVRTLSFAVAAVAIRLVPDAFPVLLTISAAYGCADGLFLPAAQALPKLYPPERLPRLQALMSFVQRASSIAGPLAGGTLVAATRPSAAFMLVASCFLFAALTMRASDGTRRHNPSNDVLARQERRRSHSLSLATLTLLALLTVGEFASTGILTTGMPLLFVDTGIDGIAAGTYLALFGIGASVSALLIYATPPVRNTQTTMLLGILGTGGCFLALGMSSNPLLMGGALVTAGLCSGTASTLIFTGYLAATSETAPARATALLYFASYGAAPVATSLAGSLSELRSPAWAISVFAVMLLVSVPLYLFVNLLATRRATRSKNT